MVTFYAQLQRSATHRPSILKFMELLIRSKHFNFSHWFYAVVLLAFHQPQTDETTREIP